MNIMRGMGRKLSGETAREKRIFVRRCVSHHSLLLQALDFLFDGVIQAPVAPNERLLVPLRNEREPRVSVSDLSLEKQQLLQI